MYLHHSRPEHSEYTNCWPKCRAERGSFSPIVGQRQRA